MSDFATSDRTSSTAKVPHVSRDQERDEVFSAVEQWHDGKRSILIPVVRSRTLKKMKKICNRRKWWQVKLNTLPATLDDFKHIIDDLSETPVSELYLPVSRHVDLPTFHIPASVASLTIIRCGHSKDKEGCMIVSMNSTFCGTPLSDWKQHGSAKHKLFLGSGVIIGTPPPVSDGLQSYERAAAKEKTQHSPFDDSAHPLGMARVADWNDQVSAAAESDSAAGSSIKAPTVTTAGISIESPAVPFLNMPSFKFSAGYYRRS